MNDKKIELNSHERLEVLLREVGNTLKRNYNFTYWEMDTQVVEANDLHGTDSTYNVTIVCRTLRTDYKLFSSSVRLDEVNRYDMLEVLYDKLCNDFMSEVLLSLEDLDNITVRGTRSDRTSIVCNFSTMVSRELMIDKLKA